MYTIPHEDFMTLMQRARASSTPAPTKAPESPPEAPEHVSISDLIRLAKPTPKEGYVVRVPIRDAIREVLEKEGELSSREIKYQIHRKRIPLSTKSQNLASLIQATLGDMSTKDEIVRTGRHGRSTYRLKTARAA